MGRQAPFNIGFREPTPARPLRSPDLVLGTVFAPSVGIMTFRRADSSESIRVLLHRFRNDFDRIEERRLSRLESEQRPAFDMTEGSSWMA